MILPENIFSDILPQSVISRRQNYPICKRAPFCIPGCPAVENPERAFRKKKNIIGGKVCGSITVEAALAIPLFFFAVLALCYLMEVMAIRTSIRSGLQYAGKTASESAYEMPVLMPGRLENDIVNAVGAERLDRSIVENGSSGLHCGKSYMSVTTGIMELKVNYEVYLPLPVFGRAAVPMEESCRMKGWTGYESAGFSGEDETTVYITETGMVYHRDYHCTYLELSIRMIPSDSVEGLRNESDGKYYPCQRCVRGSVHGGVYITDYGDRYHSSLSCSGLKRTVYAVPLSEAAGKGACSKCG